jgi:hypothetical protein
MEGDSMRLELVHRFAPAFVSLAILCLILAA